MHQEVFLTRSLAVGIRTSGLRGARNSKEQFRLYSGEPGLPFSERTTQDRESARKYFLIYGSLPIILDIFDLGESNRELNVRVP